MSNSYTSGGYIRNSNEPFISPPVIHRSECPPITLKDLNHKRTDISNPICDGIRTILMDHIEANKNLKLLKENRIRLLNYNHLFSSNAFENNCAEQLKNINKQITNIERSFLSASHRSVFTVRTEWNCPK